MKLIVLARFGGSRVLAQSVDDRTLAFGCDNLVVVGRVKNGGWHRSGGADDVLGHGWADARISVQRIVTGGRIGRTVPVRYFAHTYMRGDRDFMFVLSRQPDGSLVIDSGQLMSAHPKLAAQCD